MSDAFSAAAGTDKGTDTPERAETAPAPDSGDKVEMPQPLPLGERLGLAARQGALVAVSLIVGGAVVDRLRPDEATARDVFATPFLWAAILWLAVLVLHAVAFERSQIRHLDREPLMFAGAMGLFVFIVGVASFDAGDAGRRLLYLAANAIGAIVFWWAVASLVYLVVQIVRRD